MEGLIIAPFGILSLMCLLFRLWTCVRGVEDKPNVRAAGPVVYCAQCSGQFGGPDRMLAYIEHRKSHEENV